MMAQRDVEGRANGKSTSQCAGIVNDTRVYLVIVKLAVLLVLP
jgi:hypothetical protein